MDSKERPYILRGQHKYCCGKTGTLVRPRWLFHTPAEPDVLRAGAPQSGYGRHAAPWNNNNFADNLLGRTAVYITIYERSTSSDAEGGHRRRTNQPGYPAGKFSRRPIPNYS